MDTSPADVEEYRAFGVIGEGNVGVLPVNSTKKSHVELVEAYISNEVLPLYGNTHTTTSRTGHQSTCFRHEARQIVAQAVNAKITGKAATDVVLFTGNGTTAAINKLIQALGLHLPMPMSAANGATDSPSLRPIVFTSAYEHHSNLLPWREAEVDVVTIRLHETTGVCLDHLAEQLCIYSDRKLKIGAFAAASNVTGLITDVNSVAIAMHRAGGIVVFDYATAAPYVKVDMNPVVMGEDAAFVYKDAVFFSGHKFVGGPGSPGVLVAKKRLLPPSCHEPTLPGGGTVFYVTNDHHRYLSNREEREEGGTPNLLGDVKLGLVVHLKQLIGASWIEPEEIRTASMVHRRLAAHPSIHLLGHPRRGDAEGARHLPIVSFLIRPKGVARFLHYNFVCALLNDLFGIQSRGGCMCAGPYSQWLLGLSEYTSLNAAEEDSASEAIENALLDKQEVLRPGFTRLSLPYFTSPAKVEFVQRCVEFVADHGVLFLPQYRYNYRTGDWAHTTRLTKFPERRWLSRFDPLLAPSAAAADNVRADWLGEESYFQTSLMSAEAEVQRLLTENRKKLAKVTKVGAESTDRPLEDAALTPYENIRWFALMSDFPGNIPVHLSSADECSDTVALQGPIRPNFYFDADAAGGSRTPRYNRGTHEPSLYAQKRDKKMSSRGGASTVAPTLPRYADPSTIVGIVDKNSIGDTEVGTAASAAMNKSKCTALPQQPTGSGEAVPDPVPAPMCIAASRPPVQHSNATKLLSGVGMVFGADKTDASSSGGAAVATSCGGDDSYTPNLGDGSTGRAKVATPPKKILKPVGQAIADWGMIEEGDRLLLGLSGGKDSLTLLHILLHLQRKAPVNFTIACATVDPQTESFDPSPLIPYMQSLGVTYHYLSEPIVELAKSKMQGDSLCAFCARFKRGLLYSCCRNNGYNKLVLAQHLDDLAESFIMSSLHNGKLRTMKAHYKIDAEDLSVIRPLAYTREAHTRDFSLRARLPVINENCPACFEEPKERARVKRLLSQEEAMIPTLFSNLRKALLPLMAGETYVAMDDVTRLVEQRAKMSVQHGKKGGSGKGGKQERLRAAGNVDCEVEGDGANEGDDDEGLPKRGVAEIATGDIEDTAAATKKKRLLEEDSCSSTSGYCVPCYELA